MDRIIDLFYLIKIKISKAEHECRYDVPAFYNAVSYANSVTLANVGYDIYS